MVLLRATSRSRTFGTLRLAALAIASVFAGSALANSTLDELCISIRCSIFDIGSRRYLIPQNIIKYGPSSDTARTDSIVLRMLIRDGQADILDYSDGLMSGFALGARMQILLTSPVRSDLAGQLALILTYFRTVEAEPIPPWTNHFKYNEHGVVWDVYYSRVGDQIIDFIKCSSRPSSANAFCVASMTFEDLQIKTMFDAKWRQNWPRIKVSVQDFLSGSARGSSGANQ
jgi:hypothetical protein